MDEYYKESFQKRKLDYDKKDGIASISKAKMDLAVEKFIKETLGAAVFENNQLSCEQKCEIIDGMMAFVYAHRHNKDDKFILETKAAGFIDFSIVRDVMYKYSKKAQDRFFDHPIESYFFAKFAQ